MSAVIRPISGSFFEFEHPNRAERTHMHEAMCAFTEAQWRAQVRDMATIGCDTLVLLSTALRGCAYFPLDSFPYPPYLTCQNILEIFLDEADKTGQRVFLGVGFYGGTDSVENSTDPAIVATALRAMNALASLYGHHACLEGWYIADEWCIWERFDERFIRYINVITAEARRLNPKHKVMLAPFGTHCLKADDPYIRQLECIDADILAYQDEIGVRKMPMEQLASRFEALARAHEKAGRSKLWADIEVFEFEGDVYRSPLLPAPWERIQAQIATISPYVDKIIAYTCQNLMQPPNTPARCGNLNQAETLYAHYTMWRNTVK